jgi:hypothetical protein
VRLDVSIEPRRKKLVKTVRVGVEGALINSYANILKDGMEVINNRRPGRSKQVNTNGQGRESLCRCGAVPAYPRGLTGCREGSVVGRPIKGVPEVRLD